ncbi:MAG: DivIVA domain-containing protein [Ruminococcaceae bacterium]|nr:DivIVA domain-containing protein [Oscillospiraceae bacterium]
MLTPLDIQNKRFEKAVSGYNRTEVEDFLNEVLADYEKLYKQSIDSNDKISVLTSAIEHYKAIEETMQNTLMIAQQTADEVRKNAEEKARLMVEEAKAKANEIITTANAEIMEAKREAVAIRQSTELFKGQVIASLTAQIEAVKAIDTDPNKRSVGNIGI